MYKALLDSQSFKDPNVLNQLEVVSSYKEEWPGDDPPVLFISKVKVDDHDVLHLINNLSKNWLKPEWFALVWNEKIAQIIFPNKVFSIANKEPWIKEEIEEVISYGKKQNIDRKYFQNMKNVMSKW